MSVQTEIDRIITAVGAAYDAVEGKGGTLPVSETVANLAEAINSIPKETYQAVEQATPSLSLNAATGEVTAEATQAAGLVAAGTKKATMQLATQSAKTVTPSAAEQTAVASGKYTTGDVVVAAVPTEAKTVELSMPSGDQTVSPDAGKFLSAVTMKKPATMLPENIKKGVNIGGVVGTLESGGGGGGGGAVSPKDINFYDYDGTCVAAWSLAELAGKTALPDYPTHEGLTCQGWNWTLADLKAENAKMNVGAMYITSDGKTRIYITLQEGRTSPMLGVCPNGTVTVDWGDGTTPDRLKGTSLTAIRRTPTHNYAAPGDYVITLTVRGTFGIVGAFSGGALLCYSSGTDDRDRAYQNAIQRVFLGSGIASIGQNAFYRCFSLAQVTIPSGVTSISSSAFGSCYSLASITLPSSVTSISSSAFYYCYSLASITLPSSVTSIGKNAFSSCSSLAQVTIPSSVTSIDESVFSTCSSLAQVTIPSGVTSIGNYAFSSCYSLAQVTIPSGVTSIGGSAFYYCYSLASITLPSSVTSIGNAAFGGCYAMSFYDFTSHTAVPTLENANAFNGIPADCEIRVPAALLDEWKAAENWATYASNIVGV